VRALVVSGEDGLGEVTLGGTTHATLVEEGRIRELQWTPEDFGMERVSPEVLQDTLRVDGPAASAAMVRDVLAGKPGLARDIVILNAAAGFLAVDRGTQPKQAAEKAAQVIDRGEAAALLKQLVRLSHEGR